MGEILSRGRRLAKPERAEGEQPFRAIPSLIVGRRRAKKRSWPRLQPESSTPGPSGWGGDDELFTVWSCDQRHFEAAPFVPFL
jgi:hypothetical protein